MQRFLLALALLVALAAPAGAQPAADLPEADRAGIAAVISRQMAAFARDDVDAAFAFATPTLQGLFGDAARFIAMVRAGYQPVYRPRSVSFGDIFDVDGQIVQEVAVIGPEGAPRVALYTMERQPDGAWRIAGCYLLERPNAGS